jgi:hypothetical protein
MNRKREVLVWLVVHDVMRETCDANLNSSRISLAARDRVQTEVFYDREDAASGFREYLDLQLKILRMVACGL